MTTIHIPLDWERINPSQLSGILMVIGGPDVGKSTFAQYLYKKLCQVYSCVGYLDGDPGQSNLGPPSTMTLALNKEGDEAFPPQGHIWRSFVGSISPRGHILPILIGASRLIRVALQGGAKAVVYDTSGFIDPASGGARLKWAKIDLLHPATLLALQYHQELDVFLAPLRRSQRVSILDLPSSPQAKRRDPTARRAHRTEKFAQYFSKAHPLQVKWTRWAVFPRPFFDFDRLVALEDAEGFTKGLGIVIQIDRDSMIVELRTPLDSLDGVDALRVGDLAVDPLTFADRHLSPIR